MRKQTNQRGVRERHRLKYKLNHRGDEVQVEKHGEEGSAKEANVLLGWGDNQTGEEHGGEREHWEHR